MNLRLQIGPQNNHHAPPPIYKSFTACTHALKQQSFPYPETFSLHLMACYALIVLHLLYPCIFFVFCHAEVKCPTRFRSVFDICIHIGPRRTFCKAQEYCAAVGGELIRGSNFLALHKKTFVAMPKYYWIGLTDLTHERGYSKSGWQWSDGALEPASSELSWKGNWFQGKIGDGVIQCYFTGTLCGVGVNNNYPPVCQLRSVSSTEKCSKF